MFPQTAGDFRRYSEVFGAELSALKERVEVPDYGWYPYGSMTVLPVLANLIEPVYTEVVESIVSVPVADLGCGDGDLAMLFARFGCHVDAVDHAETNFNQLRGVEALCRALAVPVRVHDIDLSCPFQLPRDHYGLVLLLGVLYHLKDPFYALETLAACADWCVIGTRIAQITPALRTRMEDEPLAYLLGAREANDDPTNFWILSATGLLRLVERTGWMVVNQRRLGCLVESDPIRPEADERMFLLVKSRIRHPELHVRALEGWHAPENDAFRWTAKRFALEVTLPRQQPAREFALRLFVPEAVLNAGPVRISCAIQGEDAGSIHCTAAEAIEFRGRFPVATEPGATLRLEFTVDSLFKPAGDARELGICVPTLDRSQRHLQRIPFRIS